MTLAVWVFVTVVWLTLAAGCVIGWCLRESFVREARGGMLDLTPPFELYLDWSDPRDGWMASTPSWDSPIVKQWIADGSVCPPVHLQPVDEV